MHKRPKRGGVGSLQKKSLALVVASLGVIAASEYTMLDLGSHAEAEAFPGTPVISMSTLVGDWYELKGYIPGVTRLVAHVDGDMIEVDVTRGNTTGPLWIGTFSPEIPSDRFDIMSNRDAEYLDGKVFAAPGKSLIFSYDHGDLSFRHAGHEVHLMEAYAR